MTAYGLTPHAQALLEFLRAYIGAHGVPPTYTVMMAEQGHKSRSATHRLLCQLRSRGYIQWLPGRQQSLRLVNAPVYSLPSSLAAAVAFDARRRGVSFEQNLADAVHAWLKASRPAARETAEVAA